MASRLELHTILVNIIGAANRVYFQPPSNLSMLYPCIVYKRDSAFVRHADNSPYLRKKRYTVTVIDKDPDSLIPDKVASLPLTAFSRHFTADNLNHDVYNVYY